MRVLPLALLLALGTACTTQSPMIPRNYASPNAGVAIVGIGAAAGTVYGVYRLSFRRTDASPADTTTPLEGGFVFCQAATICDGARDYRTPDEEGVVDVHALPPGRYEIHAYAITDKPGTRTSYSSKSPFSIPFIVSGGRAVYIGNFQANRLTSAGLLGIPVSHGAIFVIEDRASHDTSLARRKHSQIPKEIESSVVQPKSLQHPLFVEKDSDVIRLLRREQAR